MWAAALLWGRSADFPEASFPSCPTCRCGRGHQRAVSSEMLAGSDHHRLEGACSVRLAAWALLSPEEPAGPAGWGTRGRKAGVRRAARLVETADTQPACLHTQRKHTPCAPELGLVVCDAAGADQCRSYSPFCSWALGASLPRAPQHGDTTRPALLLCLVNQERKGPSCACQSLPRHSDPFCASIWGDIQHLASRPGLCGLVSSGRQPAL